MVRTEAGLVLGHRGPSSPGLQCTHQPLPGHLLREPGSSGATGGGRRGLSEEGKLALGPHPLPPNPPPLTSLPTEVLTFPTQALAKVLSREKRATLNCFCFQAFLFLFIFLTLLLQRMFVFLPRIFLPRIFQGLISI